jgi:hypothetical protein
MVTVLEQLKVDKISDLCGIATSRGLFKKR